jgi:hypothetical protein
MINWYVTRVARTNFWPPSQPLSASSSKPARQANGRVAPKYIQSIRRRLRKPADSAAVDSSNAVSSVMI